jgi:hypothetical protein
MKTLLIVCIAGWLLAQFKTSRPDGILLRIHPYRRLMSYIMPGRNESIVYFERFVDARPLLSYLAAANTRFAVDVTHCLIASAFIALRENPKMNRFCVGHRLYQRNGTFVTFSMKRQQQDREAKLSTVKLPALDGESFRDLVARIEGQISTERSGARTYADKEFDVLNAMPRPLLRLGVALLKTLDYYNLLPGGFIANDGLYTSLFSANLGSLGMGAGFHHLYEWGTCPLFMMVGKTEDLPAVEAGQVVVRPTLHIRWSYDERIEDGLNARFGIESAVRALENPFEYFGCVAEDGNDRHPLGATGNLKRSAA